MNVSSPKTENRNRHQNRKPGYFKRKNRETGYFKRKNRKTALKNDQNRKTENLNAPLSKASFFRGALYFSLEFVINMKNFFLVLLEKQ
jgi:hypothetical protein